MTTYFFNTIHFRLFSLWLIRRYNCRQVDLIQLLHVLDIPLALLSEDHLFILLLLPPQLIKLLIPLSLKLGQPLRILILEHLINQVVQVCVDRDEIHIGHRVRHGHH